MIYHITTASWWETWTEKTIYESQTLHEEGFIHCCATQAQVVAVLEKYYVGEAGLLLLSIDPEKLNAELKNELAQNQEIYPHIYGAINKDAILSITKITTNK